MRRTVDHLESTFSRICSDSYPLEWDENHISFLLMKELRNLFSNRVIRFSNWSKIVNWQSFKNRGRQEVQYGDIALLVNVQFSSGELLKGVATIEAKRSFASGNFESLNDHKQLASFVQNAPYSHLLLYNHQKEEWQLKFPDESKWKSHLWISPGNTAVEHLKQLTKNDNQKILRTSFPSRCF